MQNILKKEGGLRKKGGFTLIELLVVISIISLLSTVILASLNAARDKARNAYVVQSVNAYRTALKAFYAEKGYYPGQTDATYYCLGRDWPTPCLGTFGSDNTAFKAQLLPYIQSWADPSPYTTNSTLVSGATAYCVNISDGVCTRMSMFWVNNTDQPCVLPGAQRFATSCYLHPNDLLTQ